MSSNSTSPSWAGSAPERLLVPVAELRRRVGNVDERDAEVALEGAEVVGTRLPHGATARVHLRLEALSDGVVVTGSAEGPWEGECRRCLDDVAGTASGDIDEVARPHPGEGELAIEDDRIDLTDAVRAAVVLGLPLAPLCREECPGPDPEGHPVSVAADRDDGPEATDEAPLDPRWAALSELHPDR
ncbi:MAG: DUF177 domain-containing protein [Microthrixaceae bacterium]